MIQFPKLSLSFREAAKALIEMSEALKAIENLKKLNTMQKNQLKRFDIVETRNGDRFMVFGDRLIRIRLDNVVTHRLLSEYTERMMHESLSLADIMKVWRFDKIIHTNMCLTGQTDTRDPIWMRKEEECDPVIPQCPNDLDVVFVWDNELNRNYSVGPCFPYFVSTTGFTTNNCCDRCGRSLDGKDYILSLGMKICGICKIEMKYGENC